MKRFKNCVKQLLIFLNSYTIYTFYLFNKLKQRYITVKFIRVFIFMYQKVISKICFQVWHKHENSIIIYIEYSYIWFICLENLNQQKFDNKN